MKERFMKNGVFSLEYDKETLKDMVLELQEENKQLKDNWHMLKKWLNNFHKLSEFEQWEIVNKIQELEEGNNHE